MSTEELDNEIRKGLAAGDTQALDLLWETYASDMLGYLITMLCSRHDAEDVLQEVFIMIARKRDTVARARKLKPYLYRMARNAGINWIKKSSRRRNREEASSEWLLPQDAYNADADRTRKLEQSLASLPEKQRIVIVMKHIKRKSFREIGEDLDISENTAGSRYRYGMAKLEELMKSDEG